MELERLQRIALVRWKILVGFAVLGLVVASVTVARRNAQVEPEFVANAAWVYERDPFDASGQQLAARLVSEQERAFQATEPVRGQFADSNVVVDEDLGQLEFTVTAPTESAAREQAREFRQAFQDFGIGQVEDGFSEELEDIVSVITDLELQVAQLTTPTPEEVANQQAIADLRIQIENLTSQANALSVELVTPDELRPAEDIQAELAAVETRIAELRTELVGIPRPEPADEIRDQIRVNALQRQITSLEEQYTEIFLQQAGFSDSGRPGAVTVQDQTPSEFSVFGSAMLGFLLGSFLGLGSILAADRLRPMVWLPTDLQTVPVLGSLPDKRPGADRSVWYTEAAPGLRKASVQRLRTSIEGRLSGDRVAIAVGGFGVSDDQTAALVADVAASFTVVGRTALLLDLGGASGSDVYELDASPVTIRQVLGDASPAEVVSREAELTEGLFAIGSGDDLLDADETAGPVFRKTLDRLVGASDVTFITPGDGEAAMAQSVYQLTDHVMFAIRIGSASVVETESFAADLRERGISVLGAVLIGSGMATRRPITQTSAVARARSPRTAQGPAGVRQESAVRHLELLSRQLEQLQRHSEARPDLIPEDEDREPTRALEVPVHVVDRPSTQSHGPSELATFVEELLSSLRQYPADKVADYVEAFLEDRLVGYLTTRHSVGEAKPGFAFVTGVGEFESAVDVLEGGLDRELGDGEARLLLDEFGLILSSAGIADGVEGWIEKRFFRRHTLTSGGEPRLWHLKSREGHVQVLVDWYRLDRDAIDLIRLKLNQMLISGMKLPMPSVDKVEAAADIRDFDAALGWLYEGTTPEARIWYPWLTPDEQPHGWDPDVRHGVKAHLAPVQRLGLLAVEVLKLNDLVSFSRSA